MGQGTFKLFSKRVSGIEPPCTAWEAAILPLNYTRKSWCPCLSVRQASPTDKGTFLILRRMESRNFCLRSKPRTKVQGASLFKDSLWTRFLFYHSPSSSSICLHLRLHSYTVLPVAPSTRRCIFLRQAGIDEPDGAEFPAHGADTARFRL